MLLQKHCAKLVDEMDRRIAETRLELYLAKIDRSVKKTDDMLEKYRRMYRELFEDKHKKSLLRTGIERVIDWKYRVTYLPKHYKKGR